MYAIIYWPNDQTVKVIENKDGSLFLMETLKGADEYAEKFQQKFPGFETRVISIESVNE